MTKHELFMKIALNEARKYKGLTHPNPAVGALIVKNDKIISIGAHKKAGHDHAEVDAIKNAKENLYGSSLYVTLEPCNHFGKTPPCTKAIIEKGIKKVYIGALDKNPLMSGKSVEFLRKNGIEVYTDILREECEELNEDFFTFIEQKRPYITLKIALSLEGKYSFEDKNLKWITSEKARNFSHFFRKEASAIGVGINTILEDNPFLNVRLRDTSYKKIVIFDKYGDFESLLKKELNILKNKEPIYVINPKIDKALDNIEFIKIPLEKDFFNLEKLYEALTQKDIIHIFIEGGGKTLSYFINEEAFDRIIIFRAFSLFKEGKFLDIKKYIPLNIYKKIDFEKEDLIILKK